MNAPDILQSAAACIGERASQRDHADGERSMARAVATFNALTAREMTEREGWIFMVILKLARAEGGRIHIDDYIDGAAYIALAGESTKAGSAPKTVRTRLPYTNEFVDLLVHPGESIDEAISRHYDERAYKKTEGEAHPEIHGESL